MITKNNRKIKDSIFTTIMISGKKEKGEKILLKSLKELQKTSLKKTSSIVSLAVKHVAPTFKMNSHKLKKKKRKVLQEVPTFIKNNFIRINLSLKFIMLNSKTHLTSTNFSNKLANELLNSTKLNSFSVKQKIELQNQILLKKNLFFKYRWDK